MKKIFITTILALFIGIVPAFAGNDFENVNFKHAKPPNQMHPLKPDDFAKKLNLTPTQIEQIKKNNEESRKKIHQIREENRRAFEAILTAEQKATLEKMKQEHKNETVKHKNYSNKSNEQSVQTLQ